LPPGRRGGMDRIAMSKLRFPNPIFVALDTPDLPKALSLGAAIKAIQNVQKELPAPAALQPAGPK